jgi:hypothetical protein
MLNKSLFKLFRMCPSVMRTNNLSKKQDVGLRVIWWSMDTIIAADSTPTSTCWAKLSRRQNFNQLIKNLFIYFIRLFKQILTFFKFF